MIPILQSTLICPHCGASERLAMPMDACLFFHQCRECHALLRPKPGDCCVFCSYGDVKCPPVQESRQSGNPSTNRSARSDSGKP